MGSPGTASWKLDTGAEANFIPRQNNWRAQWKKGVSGNFCHFSNVVQMSWFFACGLWFSRKTLPCVFFCANFSFILKKNCMQKTCRRSLHSFIQSEIKGNRICSLFRKTDGAESMEFDMNNNGIINLCCKGHYYSWVLTIAWKAGGDWWSIVIVWEPQGCSIRQRVYQLYSERKNTQSGFLRCGCGVCSYSWIESMYPVWLCKENLQPDWRSSKETILYEFKDVFEGL